MENTKCRKCGSPLNNEGLCTDVTCPYSDKQQEHSRLKDAPEVPTVDAPAYTETEEDEIGGKIAELFKLRRDSEHRDRWQTTWGTKTNIGIFRTFLEIARTINAHEELKSR